MKVIPLLAVAACALGLAACGHDRPRGYAGVYGYSDSVVIENDRGYRRDRRRYDDHRRYDDRRRDGDRRRAARNDRDGDGDRRRDDDRNRH